MLPIIYDYKNRYKNVILEQFKNSKNLTKILEIKGLYRNERQALLFSIINNFLLDTAIGVQLDIIGKIVLLDRNGRGDDSYRTLLKVKIKINNSSGQPEIIIRAVRELYNATFVKYKQIPGDIAVINILQDGEINLFEDYEGTTEDDYNLTFDTFGEFNLLTEDGFSLNTELINNIVVYDTGASNKSIFSERDDIDEGILYDIIPVGVDFSFLSYGKTESDYLLITENNEIILF